MNESTTPSSKRTFSLRSMLLGTAALAVFLALISAGLGSREYVAMFWWLAACGYLAVLSALMMGREIVKGSRSRGWAAGLFLTALLYAAANVFIFMLTISIDPYNIFEITYFVAMIIAGPVLATLAAISFAAITRKLDWFGVIGFGTWVACVSFAHFWVIVQCAASV